MSQKKISGKGLHSIASVLGRSESAADPKWEPAPNREKRDVNGIFHHTREKLMAALPLGAMGSMDPSHTKLIETYLLAGLREAYNLGHAEALAQGSEVDKMLDKQYEARTALLTPTVVCAVMEQSGMSSMTLDLARMQTVFERMDIQYTLDADTNIMSYTARPVGTDFVSGPLGQPYIHPEEIDPTDQRDTGWIGDCSKCGVEFSSDDPLIQECPACTLEADVRHQVEDIEQAAIYDDPEQNDQDGYRA